jgi:hypothetical protein
VLHYAYFFCTNITISSLPLLTRTALTIHDPIRLCAHSCLHVVPTHCCSLFEVWWAGKAYFIISALLGMLCTWYWQWFSEPVEGTLCQSWWNGQAHLGRFFTCIGLLCLCSRYVVTRLLLQLVAVHLSVYMHSSVLLDALFGSLSAFLLCAVYTASLEHVQ